MRSHQVPGETYHYRIDLAYLGGSFEGWQTQPSLQGVQDYLEKALSTVLRESIKVTGASRTDSGVHAEHQVASFQTPISFEPRRVVKSLNALLPKDIRVWSINSVDPTFHPILNAIGKIYRYRLWLTTGMTPFVNDFVWNIGEKFDLHQFLDAAKRFQGTHDFKSFCATDSSAKTTIRTIHEIHVINEFPLIEVYIYGEGFLKQMVRTIIGTLVEVAQGKRTPSDISDIIKGRNRVLAGMTAPAQGLSLVQILYEPLLSCQKLITERRLGIWHAFPASDQVRSE